jgi:hypothetical protein
MQLRTLVLSLCTLALAPLTQSSLAQTGNELHPVTPIAASAPTVVPALIPYASTAIATDGKPLKGETSMTFLLFMDEAGGQPLWAETQTVSIDPAGRFAVKLGAASPSGLPLEVFASGTARWLEVQIAGQKQQPRVLLATVPYAAKAADAATLGGLPASAFALAGSAMHDSALPAPAQTGEVKSSANSTVTTTGGVSGYVPRFSGTSTVLDSLLFSGSSGVGISTASPAAALDVNGNMIVRGPANIASSGNATSAKGFPSYGLDFSSNVYNASTKKTVKPYFALESEPSGNNTSSPSATLNLRYSAGTSEAETGFYINPNGTVHFAPAQTFPASGSSVGLSAPSSDFLVSGSPVSGKGTLGLSWIVPPTSGSIGNSIIKRDANGGFSAGVIQAGGIAAGPVNAQSLTVFNASLLDGPVTMNNKGTANSDFLLLGNTSSKGLQLRDSGSGVDMESCGVPRYLYNLSREPLYLNANGGRVAINYAGPITTGALVVGGADLSGESVSADFLADVSVDGVLFTFGGLVNSIDHPVRPTQQYLAHASIQSSELLNQYSGNATTDDAGLALVPLPDWFEAENTDFRYQLTVISGQFAQAIVAKKVENHHFTIGTNAPHVEVSWQITARRNDPFSVAHPLVVESNKPAAKKGHYMHPEVYGQTAEALHE